MVCESGSSAGSRGGRLANREGPYLRPSPGVPGPASAGEDTRDGIALANPSSMNVTRVSSLPTVIGNHWCATSWARAALPSDMISPGYSMAASGPSTAVKDGNG